MVGSAGERLMQVGRGTVFPYKESILRRREVGGLLRREIHLRMVRHVVPHPTAAVPLDFCKLMDR
jgi:hypothetical protein